MLEKILKFLSGKKSVIASLILTTSGFLGTKSIIDSDTVLYIGTMTTIIFGAASIATKNIYKK